VTRGATREAGHARAGAGRTPRPAVVPAYTWSLFLVVLFAAAFAWRWAYLGRLGQSVLAGSLTKDALTYWEWAGAIRAHGLLGTQPFFLGPLYPYVLAFVRALVGDAVPRVLVVQALWGAAAVALLADAARRLTRPALGAVIGVMLCVFEMAVFFDGLVLMESLLFFLEAFLLWWVVRSDWSAPRAAALLVLGMLIGLIAEGRAIALLLLAPAALLVQAAPAAGRTRVARGALVLAGFLLVTLPVAARNRVVSGEWIPFTYNFGYNLRVGNNPGATGTFVAITGTQQISASTAAGATAEGGIQLDGRDYLRLEKGMDLGASASAAYWSREAVRFAAAHPDRAMRLALRKLAMVWSRHEYPQIENADEYRAMAGPLGVPFLGGFALMGALAFAGLWPAWGLGARGRFVAGYAVVTTAGLAPFFVTDRYRHHLVPAAALLAAVALAWVWTSLRARSGAARLRLVAALAAGVLVVCLPTPSFRAQDYAWRLAADMGQRWLDRGRTDRALAEFERAVRLEEQAAAGGRSARIAAPRAALYLGYARALERGARGGEALPWYERARRETPDNAAVVRALADAYRRAGRTEEAEDLDGSLTSLVGGEGAALASLGWRAAQRGRFDEAERCFAGAVRKDARLFDAWGALVRVRVQLGRLPQAKAALEQARAAGMPAPALHAHEAFIAAAGGDFTTARTALAEVPESALAADAALAEVARVTRALIEGGRVGPPGH
jgi:tetratricopeptide (TPR) repeat protein